jgi:hypothetical protein
MDLTATIRLCGCPFSCNQTGEGTGARKITLQWTRLSAWNRVIFAGGDFVGIEIVVELPPLSSRAA